tara:strand:- start:1147 stop:2376 length:1230 start_codon:yes stop_codon:yes gene_type:complete
MIDKKKQLLTNLIIFKKNDNSYIIPDFNGNTNSTDNNNKYLPKLKNIIRVFLGEKPKDSKTTNKYHKIVNNSYINKQKNNLQLKLLYDFDKMHLFSPIGVSNNKSLAAVNKLTNNKFGFVSHYIEDKNIFYSTYDKESKYNINYDINYDIDNIVNNLLHYLSKDEKGGIKNIIINKKEDHIIKILFTILKYKIGEIEYRKLNNNTDSANTIVTKIKHDYKNVNKLSNNITRINYILQYSIKLYKLITYCEKFIFASNLELQVKLKHENPIYNINLNNNILFHPHFESIIKSLQNKDNIKQENEFNINLKNKKVIQLYNDLYKYNKNIHYELKDRNTKYINLLLTQFEKVSPRYTNNMLFKCVRNIYKLLNKINNYSIFMKDLEKNIQFYTSTKYVKLITDNIINDTKSK